MPENLAGRARRRGAVVLDSWPVMEWLKAREPGATLMDSLIEDAESGDLMLLMSTINLGEIYYNSWNVWGEDQAYAIVNRLRALPINVIHPTSEDALSAAKIKGQYKVAYADAFAAVLSLEFGAPVLSGDPDFLRLKEAAFIQVEWLGA